MPNLLKERLVYVLNRDNNNYLELVNFFLDPDISLFDKEKKSTQFLKNEFELLNDANAYKLSLKSKHVFFSELV